MKTIGASIGSGDNVLDALICPEGGFPKLLANQLLAHSRLALLESRQQVYRRQEQELSLLALPALLVSRERKTALRCDVATQLAGMHRRQKHWNGRRMLPC